MSNHKEKTTHIITLTKADRELLQYIYNLLRAEGRDRYAARFQERISNRIVEVKEDSL